MSYVDKILPYACTLYSHSQQEKNSISIYAFVLILCMFTMYVFVYHLYLLNKICLNQTNMSVLIIGVKI